MENKLCNVCGRDGYRNPAVTVDAVVLRKGPNGGEVLLINEGLFLLNGKVSGHFQGVLSIMEKVQKLR